MNTTDTWMMGGGLPKAVRMIGEGQYLNWEELMAGMTSGAAMTSTALAYSSVVWAYRCANMRALTIGGLPWHITNSRDEEIEWPLAQALGKILDDIEMALCLWGASYVLKQANRVKTLGLQWLNPTTMKPVTGPTGITRFEQKLEGQTDPTKFEPEQIIYHRLFNPSDDLGPGVAPMQVALSAAGLAKNANTFAEKFFEHGAMPLVLFTTDQALPKGEAERVKSWWDRTFGGVMNSWRSGILGNGLKPITIGLPIKDMILIELLGEVRKQICVAFGIPQTMLEDAAYVTSVHEHKLSFYYETVFPEAKIIAAGLNEQLFEPQGLEFEFCFEQVEAVQQDEATKTAATVILFDKGIITKNEAREQLGYEALEEEVSPVVEEAPVEEEVETPPPAPPGRGLSKEALKEIGEWRAWLRNKHNDKFRCDHLPAWLSSMINVRLARADLADHAVAASLFDPALRKFSRESAEKKLAKKLAGHYVEVFDDIVKALDAGKIPAAVLDALGKNIGGTLAENLAVVIADALLAQSVEFGTPLQDYEGTINDAAKWAQKYAFDEVKDIKQTQAETLQDTIGKLANGEIDHDAAVASLTDVFGPVRAEMIATTEVTRATAESVHIYKTDLADRGVKTVERWLTAEDELVCEEICKGLDHTTEEVWSKVVPGGPPSHPRCRCMLSLERAD